MTNHVMLNNEAHLDLKVLPKFGEQFGHNVGRVIVLPNEIDVLHVEFPLLFSPAENENEFHCIALLGFEATENLFVQDERWIASQLPLLMAKGPFVIGFQKNQDNPTEPDNAVLLIDTDDARVNTEEGHPLFLEFGGHSPYLENIQNVMKRVDDGVQLASEFSAVLTQLDLLEPVSLEVATGPEQKAVLEGYYTISQKKLSELSDDVVLKLHRSGYLAIMNWVIGSMNNMQKLVSLKIRQLGA